MFPYVSLSFFVHEINKIPQVFISIWPKIRWRASRASGGRPGRHARPLFGGKIRQNIRHFLWRFFLRYHLRYSRLWKPDQRASDERTSYKWICVSDVESSGGSRHPRPPEKIRLMNHLRPLRGRNFLYSGPRQGPSSRVPIRVQLSFAPGVMQLHLLNGSNICIDFLEKGAKYPYGLRQRWSHNWIYRIRRKPRKQSLAVLC